MDFNLLKQLCQVHAPSGNEGAMKEFILDHVQKHQHNWLHKPQIFQGKGFQDCLILVFGTPRTAIFAHMDSIGFMVKYQNELTRIGKPQLREGDVLIGRDRKGEIECEVSVQGEKAFVDFEREIDRGTELVFKCDFRTSDEFVQSCYLDNRLGCWNALKVAETLEDGIICFSCWEEHSGGSVGYLAKFIYEEYGVHQALISDISWVTKGVKHSKGAVISLRDRGIPRRAFVQKVIERSKKSGHSFQLEVENDGGSDGIFLQQSPYPIDWCFVGAAENNVHTPDEKVHRNDIASMLGLYQHLMKSL